VPTKPAYRPVRSRLIGPVLGRTLTTLIVAVRSGWFLADTEERSTGGSR
jgi:hypothetical protein